MTYLQNGSTGDEVRKLQSALNSKGYSLDEDGAFGDLTEAAVRDYQSKNNLDVDGVVGDKTWGSLYNSPSLTSGTDSTTATTDEYGLVKPTYTSKYEQNINDTLDQILNREKFSYDASSDPLYSYYRDRYVSEGDRAAKDAAAKTAALSGGYANSYATTAAAQANQNYLSKLNDIIPTLENQAYNRYQDEGDALNTRLALYRDLENTDYSRYADALSQYNADRSAAISKATASSKSSSSSSSKDGEIDEIEEQYDNFLQALAAIADSDDTDATAGIDLADKAYTNGYINKSQRNALYDQARGKAQTAYYNNQQKALTLSDINKARDNWGLSARSSYTSSLGNKTAK